jgi:hypothetical protein
MRDAVDRVLFPGGKKPLEPAEIARLDEQYKTVVEMLDRVRARRQQSNKFYLSINTAIVAAIKIGEIDAAHPAISSLQKDRRASTGIIYLSGVTSRGLRAG